jgi:hypothetical protein
LKVSKIRVLKNHRPITIIASVLRRDVIVTILRHRGPRDSLASRATHLLTKDAKGQK